MCSTRGRRSGAAPVSGHDAPTAAPHPTRALAPKNHLEAWGPTDYAPGQMLASVFTGTGSLGSTTLLKALKFGGGSSLTEKKQILLRAAVASLLNAAHPRVDFDRSVADVVATVNAALASGNAGSIIGLAASLDKGNNAGCRLN